MISSFKKRLYFVVAAYFGFWARIVLWRWKPRVVVVTGSSGKTTTLHLIEAQLGDQATYSHHANSAIGLPFFILGMPPNVERRSQWLLTFVIAPFKIFRRLPQQKLFIAEADTDRPHEGAFLSTLLKPEVTLWVSVYNTHALNFDYLAGTSQFPKVIDAIAYEFGHFLAQTRKMALINGDQEKLVAQSGRAIFKPEIKKISKTSLTNFKIEKGLTIYRFGKLQMTLRGLNPRELGTAILMVRALTEYLGVHFDPNFLKFNQPPGRSSVFEGVKSTTIIDSTYNTGTEAMTAMLALFAEHTAKNKWAVVGDILEQGKLEAAQHRALAHAIATSKPRRVILLGPRTKKDTLPELKKILPKTIIVSFESPKEVLDYLLAELKGGETLFFKGGRFLEGVIEQLLRNPEDAQHLVRRDPVWTARRQKWGLPH